MQCHRLEAGDDPAQLLGGIPGDLERAGCDPLAGCRVVHLERVHGGVEHLRERGDVLHRAVVELFGDPAPLRPLGE